MPSSSQLAAILRGPGRDQYIAGVLALWHFNGNLVDSSPANRSITKNDCNVVTSPSLFGSGSLQIGQAGGFVGAVSPGAMALSPAGGAYTIEFAFVGPSTSVGVVLRGSVSNEFIFGWNWFGADTARMSIVTKNGAGIAMNSPLLNFAGDNTFHRYALVRQVSGVTTLYVDGVAGPSATDSQIMNVTSSIGFLDGVASPQGAYLDEVRITGNVARYVGASYTLATNEFPSK